VTAKECAHCGRVCGDFDGGWATVTDLAGKSVPVCHPNALGRPDCYSLVTVYHERLGSRR
jgi:hypothetical protein